MAKPTPIEEHFQRIEATIAALESGELPLDEALKRYEAGIAAIRQATTQLDQYAAKLEELRGEGGR